MNLRLILTWDIRPGKEKEYFEFVVKAFLPRIEDMGLELKDAWVTVYGDHPQVLVSAEMPSLQHARKILHSTGWLDLNERMEELVDRYTYKLVPSRGAFQF